MSAIPTRPGTVESGNEIDEANAAIYIVACDHCDLRMTADELDEHSRTCRDGGAQHHPAPWWFRLLSRWFPRRCREIPEARDPDRILLRQFAIVKRHVYLQQFASGEDPAWWHSHQWRRTFALGLWGSYTERRPSFRREVRAPYLYTMGPDVIHHVILPSPGHTSIFIGIGRDDDLKHYYMSHGVPWEKHILKMVKRI